MKPKLKKVLKNEDRYLIATDLDGTFLAHGGNMTHHTINYKAFKKLEEMGHKVVLASGRSPQLMRPTYKQLGIETPMISFHGGLISDPTGTHPDLELNDQKIPLEVIKDIVTKTNIMEHTLITEYIGNEASNSFTEKTDLEVIDYDAYELVFATKFGDYDSKDADKILAPWKDIIDWIFMPGDSGLSYDMIIIVPPGVNKRNALERLSMYYMIPQERIIYFGDNTNDMEAIKYAGHGVAMISGAEHVKDIADTLTDYSATEGGVGKYIFDYLIKE